MFYWHPYDISSVPFPSLASKTQEENSCSIKQLKMESKSEKITTSF